MDEPLFRAIGSSDNQMQDAYDLAAKTIAQFIELVKNNSSSTTLAKLRFRDPDLSDEVGEDQYLYIWLHEIHYHEEERLLSGVFFELPSGFEKWHQVGERLGFEPEDVFDWAVIDNAHAKGGFTLRVIRSRLGTEREKQEYDEHVGISSYEPAQ